MQLEQKQATGVMQNLTKRRKQLRVMGARAQSRKILARNQQLAVDVAVKLEVQV